MENKPEDFDSFLWHEYDNIAQAHFKTNETISDFFKSYLTIVTIPITVLGVAANLGFVKKELSYLTKPGTTSVAGQGISFLVLIIGLVGFCVFWYLLNLRWDSLLYARTVNGIRRYFFNKGINLSLFEKERMRVLPQSTQFPRYKEMHYFGPIVLACIMLNTLYIQAGVFGLCYFFGNKKPLTEPLFWIFFVMSLIVHLVLYNKLADRREYGRRRYHILGVDIDGVLNKHRDQFAYYINLIRGKEINSKKITRIPAHECKNLGITDEDEKAVFNTPEYWTSMEVNDKANEILLKLHNTYKINIHIFTSRSWPVIKDDECKDNKRAIRKLWKQVSKNYYQMTYQNRPFRIRIKRFFRTFTDLFPYRILHISSLFKKISPIESITKTWLDDKNIYFDKLVVEFGSDDVSDPSSQIYNRFFAARTMPIKYFVEDDLTKARKLSFVCDVVFLIDHPYNADEHLPKNVIRVNTWQEIHDAMRELI